MYVGLFICLCATVFLLIWVNRHNLGSFHFDRISIFAVLVFSTILRIRVFDSLSTFFLEFLFFCAAILFVYIFVKAKPIIPEYKILNKWSFIGIGAGLACAVLIKLLRPTQIFDLINQTSLLVYLSTFFQQVVYQFGTAAILEESIFRGFLWGFFKDIGWNEKLIFVVQACLYMLSHLFYWDKPIAFWFFVPVWGVIYGLLAWKSRSVFPSMLAHAFYNAVIAVL
ncbi:MAG: hypothetical protein CVU39_20005 [Chloroflexi bacterium HGW-Chloroflexi-10]|nr:MAG: hypothetical protein CVU39_20005 [Chloroflexi bacterium HGW-Chloroflexi-10]